MVDVTRTKGWGWWVAFGILLILLGLVLLGTPVVGSLASVFVLGCLLVAGGFLHVVTAFMERPSDDFWMHLLVAAFMFVIGILMLSHPDATLVTLTLLIAAFFLGVGVFRTLSALVAKFKGWGWVLLNGLISLILGILILVHWPAASLWVIGLFLGIDFIFAGWSIIMSAIYVKKVTVI